VRPVLVVLLPPLLAGVLRFLYVTKEIAIETFLAQLAEKALDKGIGSTRELHPKRTVK
jgi:hypothetical protein